VDAGILALPAPDGGVDAAGDRAIGRVSLEDITMNRSNRFLAAVALAACGLTLTAAPALADSNLRCGAGAKETWQPINKVKKKAWLEGWKVLKAQVEGDCYEVYARTENGQAIEAFFHPVTLQKLVVYRRGEEIYRAPGFKG
jgi:hypothetical protein